MRNLSLSLSTASTKEKVVLLFCLLITLTILLHIGFLENKFIDGDDLTRVVQNPLIRNITPKGFLYDIQGFYSYQYPSFLLTYFWGLVFSVWELNHIGFHLISYLLHAFCVGLLFLFLFRVTRNILPSVAGAFLFGLHPIHCEAVNWINRQDLVIATFLGLSFLHLSASERRYVRYLSAVLIFAAVGFSPIAVMFPLGAWLMRETPARGGARKIFLFTLGCLLLLWGRKIEPFSLPALFYHPVPSILFGLQAFFMPWKIHFLIPRLSDSEFSLWILSLVILIVVGGMAMKTKRRAWWAGFLALLSLWLLHGFSMRFNGAFSYPPLLWGSLALGLSLSDIVTKDLYPKGLTLFMAAVFAVFGFMCYKRNQVWSKTETLLEDALETSPNDPLLLSMMGHYKAAFRDAKAAEAFFKRVRKQTRTTLCLKAKAYHLLMKNEAASRLYEKLFTEYPKAGMDKFCLFDKATLLYHQGLPRHAKEVLKKICRLDPFFIYAWHDLGTIFMKEGNTKQALEAFRKVLDTAPAYRPTLENLAYYFMERKAYAEARLYIAQALASTSCRDTQKFYRAWLASLEKKKRFVFAAIQWADLAPPG